MRHRIGGRLLKGANEAPSGSRGAVIPPAVRFRLSDRTGTSPPTRTHRRVNTSDAPTDDIVHDVRAATDERAAARTIAATPDVPWAMAVNAPTTSAALEVSATVDPHDAHDSVTSVRPAEHDHGWLGDQHAADAAHDDASVDDTASDDATPAHEEPAVVATATTDTHDTTDATETAAPDHGDAAHAA